MNIFTFMKKIIKKAASKKKAAVKRKKMKKEVISLNLKRVGLETLLTIKASPEIEEFFKRAASNRDEVRRRDNGQETNTATQTSSNWKDADNNGLLFYTKNEKLSNKVSGYSSVIDNFGNGLMDNDNINLALLRVVGISNPEGKTVKTTDLLSYEEMKTYTEELALWTKAFYENHLRSQELSASITLEV